MAKDTFLVLRLSAAPDTFDPLQPASRTAGASLAAAGAVDYRIETPELDEQDYRELRHDRAVAAIAQPMPVQLIAPVPRAGPAGEPAPVDGATWGVQVTGALQSPYLGRGVTVAVLDTGIDAKHEAFRGIELVHVNRRCRDPGGRR